MVKRRSFLRVEWRPVLHVLRVVINDCENVVSSNFTRFGSVTASSFSQVHGTSPNLDSLQHAVNDNSQIAGAAGGECPQHLISALKEVCGDLQFPDGSDGVSRQRPSEPQAVVIGRASTAARTKPSPMIECGKRSLASRTSEITGCLNWGFHAS